jgi:hypothetical protein
MATGQNHEERVRHLVAHLEGTQCRVFDTGHTATQPTQLVQLIRHEKLHWSLLGT